MSMVMMFTRRWSVNRGHGRHGVRCCRSVAKVVHPAHLCRRWVPSAGTPSSEAVLAAALGRVFGFWVCVALVSMTEPSRALLLAADQSNPIIAACA